MSKVRVRGGGGIRAFFSAQRAAPCPAWHCSRALPGHVFPRTFSSSSPAAARLRLLYPVNRFRYVVLAAAAALAARRRSTTHLDRLQKLPCLQQLRQARVGRPHDANGAERLDQRQQLLLLAMLVQNMQPLVNAAAGAPQVAPLVFADDVGQAELLLKLGNALEAGQGRNNEGGTAWVGPAPCRVSARRGAARRRGAYRKLLHKLLVVLKHQLRQLLGDLKKGRRGGVTRGEEG